MEVANEWVARDEILSGTIDNLQNIPENYKVSKENGLEAFEDELELLGVEMDDEPNV